MLRCMDALTDHILAVPGTVVRALKGMLYPPAMARNDPRVEIECELIAQYEVIARGVVNTNRYGCHFIFTPSKNARATAVRVTTNRGHQWEFPIMAGVGHDVRKHSPVAYGFPFQMLD